MIVVLTIHVLFDNLNMALAVNIIVACRCIWEKQQLVLRHILSASLMGQVKQGCATSLSELSPCLYSYYKCWQAALQHALVPLPA
jgi:hypothetical protein